MKKTSDESVKVLATDIALTSSTKTYPRDWKEQAAQIISGLNQHGIDLGSDRNADGILARIESVDQLDKGILDQETQLAVSRESREKQRLAIWQLTSSIRATVGGLYGMDSMEYQSVGGTRTSERKRSPRKPKPTKS